MKLPQPLISGILLKRYQRFLADIHLSTGEVITAHCPNSGRLSGLSTPGNPVQVWKSSNPRRRLLYTWEMVRVNSIWVGINTNRSTALAVEAIENGIITQLQGYGGIQTEVRLEADNRFRQGAWLPVLPGRLIRPGLICDFSATRLIASLKSRM